MLLYVLFLLYLDGWSYSVKTRSLKQQHHREGKSYAGFCALTDESSARDRQIFAGSTCMEDL